MSPPRADPASAPVVSGVRITHAERLMFPELRLTKLDVARYYERMAPAMLPHLRGRPLTLVFCPQGVGESCRYLRHSKVWGPTAIRRIRIQEKTKIGEYMIADTETALVSLAQMNVIEIHTWNSTAERLEQPDRIVLDLDPGDQVGWADVVGAARALRRLLSALGLKSWVKTTGGRGLHVVVPIVPAADWSECLAFARGVATLMVERDGRRYTLDFRKSGRRRKILIDYLRNNRTNTSICAFSVRARTGAPISLPIAWADLARVHPARVTVITAATATFRRRRDPWRDYWRTKQRLPLR